jgi:glyoxylase-like metal-dependent hydrolase (beta-lactamase superfamily II)
MTMRDVRQIGRRIWLARSASGLMALWSALSLGHGRQGWGILLGQPAAAAQLAPRLLRARIETELPGFGRFDVQAYVAVRGREAAVVDTLLPGNAGTLAEVLQSAGLGYDAVRHVILTHWHPDHAGSAADIAGLAPSATFYAGAPDLAALEAGNAQFGVAPLRQPLRAVDDGDEIFGLRIIATPGHTAGHISVLDAAGSALIVGDALVSIGGQLSGSVLGVTEDHVQATRSLQKLADLRFDRALLAHGPEISSGAPAAIAQLLARYPRSSDGQSLEIQSVETQAAFASAYGERAGAEWVREHEAELLRQPA